MSTIYYSAIDVISRWIQVLYGIMIAVILLIIFVGTAIDLMYLMIPIFASSLDKMLDGKRLGGFRFLSKDAVLAKEEAAETGTHCVVSYLKRRLVTYIIVSIVIYILFVGPDRLVMYLFDIATPFLKSLGLLKEG